MELSLKAGRSHHFAVPPADDAIVNASRREFLRRCGTGLGSLALASLLADQAGTATQAQAMAAALDARAGTGGSALAPKPSHYPGKAKQLVHLFMNGGPSQVDTFDPKPMLEQYHGQPLPSGNLRTERKTGALMKSPFGFKKYGESGIEVSDLWAQTAQHVDGMAVLRSMTAEVPNHEPSLMLMNCGDVRMPRPSVGAWLTYGLGSENANLPGFLVMCPGGYPIVSTQNWRSAFLPGVYQGTYLNTQESDITKLIANIQNPRLDLTTQRKQLDLLREMNAAHLAARENEPDLEARLQSFELAYRMQMEATDAFDLSQETQATLNAYGTETHGRQLIYTRRLLERGVRMIQVWSGAGQPWDNHEDLENQHRNLSGQWDKPLAAFLADLKARGLWDSTLVLWGGEFGRTPVAELPKLNGRDHNHYGFTCWLAGGAVKGGTVYGATDDFGFRAVDKPIHVHDLHATMLHMLGLDHRRLVYRLAGRDYRLTDIAGNIIQDIVA